MYSISLLCLVFIIIYSNSLPRMAMSEMPYPGTKLGDLNQYDTTMFY